MQIEERRVGDVVVLSISGDISEGDDRSTLLSDTVRALLQQGHDHLLLDLSNVRYVDSYGLGDLVQCNCTAHSGGASLKLLNPTKQLTNLLELTKLLTVFECFDRESEAIASFNTA